MVLQSANVSSSAEFDSSLFTTTTFSANNIPALKRSSKLQTKLRFIIIHVKMFQNNRINYTKHNLVT